MQVHWRALTVLMIARTSMGFQFQSIASVSLDLVALCGRLEGATLFSPPHANDTDALAWKQSCHDRRLTSRCAPTNDGGAVGKWPAERPSRGERRQATYPQRGSAEEDGNRRSPAMVRVARQSRKRGHDAVCVEDPVSCALMSGLLRGRCRWPSWVCACVLGANLKSVLEAHSR